MYVLAYTRRTVWLVSSPVAGVEHVRSLPRLLRDCPPTTREPETCEVLELKSNTQTLHPFLITFFILNNNLQINIIENEYNYCNQIG